MIEVLDNSKDGIYNSNMQLIDSFTDYSSKNLDFDKPVTIELMDDEENAKNPLGTTAHYNPDKMKITIYVTGRHIKDILRSISHELIHHVQNCRGDLSGMQDTSLGYAQRDKHMRDMEAEAFNSGNIMIFRDFEDNYKQGNCKMSKLQENRLRRLNNLLMSQDKKVLEEKTLAGTYRGVTFTGDPDEGGLRKVSLDGNTVRDIADCRRPKRVADYIKEQVNSNFVNKNELLLLVLGIDSCAQKRKLSNVVSSLNMSKTEDLYDYITDNIGMRHPELKKLKKRLFYRLKGPNAGDVPTKEPSPGEEVAKFIAQQQQEDPPRSKQEKLPKGDALVKAFRKGDIVQIEFVAGQTLELIENIQKMFEQINHPGLIAKSADLKKLRRDISASIMKLKGSIQTAANRAKPDSMKKYLLDTYKRLKRLPLSILEFEKIIRNLLDINATATRRANERGFWTDEEVNVELLPNVRAAAKAALINLRQIKSDIEKAQQKLRSVPALGIQDTERSQRIADLEDRVGQQGPEQVATARGSGRGGRRSYKRKCSATTKPYIRIGCGGDNVELIQTVLYKKYKDTTLKGVKQEDFIDGKYGKTTSNIVKQFQKENGIRRDGIVGPETIKKMKKVFGPALTGKGKAGPVATKKGPAGQPGQPAQDALGPVANVPPAVMNLIDSFDPAITRLQAIRAVRDAIINKAIAASKRSMALRMQLKGAPQRAYRTLLYLIDNQKVHPGAAWEAVYTLFGDSGKNYFDPKGRTSAGPLDSDEVVAQREKLKKTFTDKFQKLFNAEVDEIDTRIGVK